MTIDRITKRSVDAVSPGETIWDKRLRGFGVRCQRERKSFIIRYRTGRGRRAPLRLYTIGVFGSPWTVDKARMEAERLLAEAKLGKDPALAKNREKSALTVSELADQYLEAAKVMPTRRGTVKAASTLQSDVYRVNALIRPLLGQRLVRSLTKRDVEILLENIAAGKLGKQTSKPKLRGKSMARGGRGTATRSIGLLGAILEYAVQIGEIDVNPARGVRKYKTEVKKRRLNTEEYKSMGTALKNAKEDEKLAMSANIASLLCLTGWRRGEVISLKWHDVDLPSRTALLEHTKTGRSLRPLSKKAVKIIKRQPRIIDCPYVFPATRSDGPFGGFPKHFGDIREWAGLSSSITPHTLRHSFASVAAEIGYSEATIAALLGHASLTVTSRYTHIADEVLLSAADKVSKHIKKMMAL